MLFLEGTPDTVNYLLAGYAVLLGFPLLYILSWIYRRRGLKREREMLQTMQAEKEAADKAKKKRG
jgi:hypothetical protein